MSTDLYQRFGFDETAKTILIEQGFTEEWQLCAIAQLTYGLNWNELDMQPFLDVAPTLMIWQAARFHYELRGCLLALFGPLMNSIRRALELRR